MAEIIKQNQLDYLKSFSINNNELLGEMEEFAIINKVPILDRLASDFLQQLLQIHSPKSVLEIGMAIGYSTIRIAENIEKKAKIETIELSKVNIDLAKGFISRSDVKSKIKIREGNAIEILPKLTKKYNLIFLDADKEYYDRLFELSIDLLIEGGIYIVDNLLWKGYSAAKNVPTKFKRSTEVIRQFNKKFLSSPKLNSKIYPIGDGIGVGIKIWQKKGATQKVLIAPHKI